MLRSRSMARRRSLRSIALAAMVVSALYWVWHTQIRSARSAPRDGQSQEGNSPALAATVAGEDHRQPIVASQSITLTVLDDQAAPVGGVDVELLALADGTRCHPRTTSAGTVSVCPGDYCVWIHGDGIVDAFGACNLATDCTLRVERGGEVTLTFAEGSAPLSGIRAKLLLEAPRDRGENTLGLERAVMRRRYFEGDVPAAQLATLTTGFRERAPFGWACDDRLAEQTSDTAGRVTWTTVPPGTYRWQLLSGERIAFEPPYEVEQFSETPRGGLQINAVPRDLSGAFSVLPGQSVTRRQKVLRASRVLGVVLGEGGLPVEGARITLRAVAHARVTTDVAMAPEAYARSGTHGTFLFENVTPGEKMVFSILDKSQDHHFWISNEAVEFMLAEGEERDIGVLSMAGGTVEIGTRLVGDGGRTLAVGDVVEEKEPQAYLTFTNGLQRGKGFSTLFWMRIGEGEVYTLHGLAPMVSATLSGVKGAVNGRPWTLKRGFREDLTRAVERRFDPYSEPRVVLDIPIQEVGACELFLPLPAGFSPQRDSSLYGVAFRQSDRQRSSIQLGKVAGGLGGELKLPPGAYEFFLGTSLAVGANTFFARGKFDVPSQVRHEFPLERGVVVTGIVVDGVGVTAPSRAVRVGFSGMRESEWWGSIWTDANGRFELGGIPPDCTLVFEGSLRPIHIGGADLANARVELRAP